VISTNIQQAKQSICTPPENQLTILPTTLEQNSSQNAIVVLNNILLVRLTILPVTKVVNGIAHQAPLLIVQSNVAQHVDQSTVVPFVISLHVISTRVPGEKEDPNKNTRQHHKKRGKKKKEKRRRRKKNTRDTHQKYS
jgi:hypothetical protein